MLQRDETRALLLILLLGCILRIAAIFISVDLTSLSDWEYGEIARNIVSGNGYARVSDPGGSLEITSSHAPLYPYFLAFFYQFGQHKVVYLVIFLVQVVLSTLTVYILYHIARRVNTRVALITALITALYPPLIYYSVKLTPTTIFLFLFSLSILLLTMVHQRQLFSAVCGGGTLGAAVLCNPIAGALFPACLVMSLMKKEIGFRWCGLVLLASLIIVAPWTCRNFKVHGRVVPITTQFPINLWIGNNPHATGTDYYESLSVLNNEPVLMTKTLSRSDRRSLSTQKEIDRADFFLREALDFIKTNSAAFVHLLATKTWYYWWFAPPSLSPSSDAIQYRTLYGIVYIPLLLLGIIGVAVGLDCCRSYTIFTMVTIAVLSTIYVITHVGLLRYRIPAEMMLIPFAALAIERLISLVQKDISRSVDRILVSLAF